jgi:hypothetical protein
MGFLERVGAGSFESYLGRFGVEPRRALEDRLGWALWRQHDPTDQAEARFLLSHEAALRQVLAEGEAPWHLRHQRAERRGQPVPPPPSLGAAPTVVPTLPEAPPVAIPPASSAGRGLRASEAVTVVREDMALQGPRTAPPVSRRSAMPLGLDRTIVDLDPEATDVDPGLRMAKTALDDGPDLRLPSSPGLPPPAPEVQGGAVLWALAAGFALLGLGALALAAAILFRGPV